MIAEPNTLRSLMIGKSRVETMQREVAAGSLTESEIAEWSARVYGKQNFPGAGKTNAGLLGPLERRRRSFCRASRVGLKLIT